jgi:transcriptional regulator with XRE-family HTH domain
LKTRQILAANIRRLRTGLDLSQEGLADIAGLHRNYIGGIERCERNVSVDNIGRLAKALGVPAAKLLDGA